MKGDPRFHELLREIGALHDKKQADYGSKEDPFANVRSAGEFGIEPWVGVAIRLNDKMSRLKQAARGNEMQNESIEDTFMDGAVYNLIGLILYREAQE